MVELPFVFGRCVGYPVDTWKEAKEVIKASVLGIDHDDRLDFGEILLCVRGVRARQTDGCPCKRGKVILINENPEFA
jgi:hypothetical protein